MNPAAKGPAGIPALYLCTQVAPSQAGELQGYSLSPSTKQCLSTCSFYSLNSSSLRGEGYILRPSKHAPSSTVASLKISRLFPIVNCSRIHHANALPSQTKISFGIYTSTPQADWRSTVVKQMHFGPPLNILSYYFKCLWGWWLASPQVRSRAANVIGLASLLQKRNRKPGCLHCWI